MLTELDRNFIISHSIKSYYFDNFPRQIKYGIYNSMHKFLNKKYIYDVDLVKFNSFLKKYKSDILKSYLKSPEKIQILAHSTSKMLKSDKTYKYIFFMYNGKISDRVKYFPNIDKLLSRNKNIRTCFLSIMSSKKLIPYHRGPYSGFLRYHFPIKVKPYSCYLEVMGKKLYNHLPFLFDDTYPHMLHKLDDSLRLVLICDIINPFFDFNIY